MNDKDGGDSGPETPTPHSQALTRSTKKRRRSSSPSDNHGGKKQALERLPPAVLLLSLPGLLAVPPNHKQQVACYELSLKALRKCVALGGLAPDIECRAWMGIAELGLRLVRAGWHAPTARPSPVAATGIVFLPRQDVIRETRYATQGLVKSSHTSPVYGFSSAALDDPSRPLMSSCLAVL